ncbi:MAG: hypothetical protein WD965_09500, partial [Actinomycetota bacterium]
MLVMTCVLIVTSVSRVLVVTGMRSRALRLVHVVRRVRRSVIGVARFVNALLGDLGGIVPLRVVPGVLVSVLIVAHPVLLDLGTPRNLLAFPASSRP